MLKTLTRIYSWFNFCFKSLASIFKIIFLSKNSKDFRNLKKINNDILILGNGPSLKPFIEENIEKISKYDIIAVNHFAISEHYTELKPKFYIAIAFDLFLDNVMPHFIEASNKLFNAIADKTDWELNFFISSAAKNHLRWQQILAKNKNIEIIYLNLTPIEGFRSFVFRNFNKAKGMPRPHNVMVPAIFIAIKLTNKNVFLSGVDHSWLRELHVDNDNKVLFYNQHFYDKDIKAKQFDYSGQRYMKLHEILNTMSKAFESYHILQEYAEYKQIKIINLTQNSYIDAFEKADFNEL